MNNLQQQPLDHKFSILFPNFWKWSTLRVGRTFLNGSFGSFCLDPFVWILLLAYIPIWPWFKFWTTNSSISQGWLKPVLHKNKWISCNMKISENHCGIFCRFSFVTFYTLFCVFLIIPKIQLITCTHFCNLCR